MTQQVECIDHVLWDWNGTLLDDVALCLDALNVLLERRGKRPVGLDEYRAKFTFPVIEYYQAVGFDLETEPFEGPAQEWTDLYSGGVWTKTKLYDGAEDVLDFVRAKGIRQSVLSAYLHEMLAKVIAHFGVAEYFDDTLGLGDFYAESKRDLGHAWLADASVDPARVLMIGDTLHDHEVAAALGIHCVLLAQGHQSKERLLAAGVPVLDAITDVREFLEQAAGVGSD